MQTIPGKITFQICILAAFCAIAQAGFAQVKSISLRAGVPVNDNDNGFRQYEVFGDFHLAKISGSKSGWQFDVRLDGVASLLEQSDKWAYLFSAGPAFMLSKTGSRLALKFGSSPTFLSNARFPHKNLGGHFHFISHIGLTLRVAGKWGVVYRIQHLSNASTVQPNPGLNLHMFGVGMQLN